MIFQGTPLEGVFLIDLEPRVDERGFFARVFCEQEFVARGLASRFVQVDDSLSVARGTLRGMHYQLPPRAETKVVRCVSGALHDVVLDLRPGSPTFGQSFGAELSAANRRMMYVPKGCAHGFVTLTEGVEAIYLLDEPYAPDLERGIRWDDPAFDLRWPIAPVVISEKDRRHPSFDPAWHLPGGLGA